MTDGSRPRPRAARPDVLTVAVIGAGTMGTGIAGLLAGAGHRVRVHDRLPDVVDRWLQSLPDHESTRRISSADSVERAVDGADLTIEAVAEDLDVKYDVIKTISAQAAPGSVIATNTSSFPIDDLAAHCNEPARFLGIHFFNPADIIPGVEVIPGAETAPATVARVSIWLEHAGKVPVTVRSSPGFITNRLQMALFLECLACVEEGLVSFEDLDNVVRTTFGFRLPLFGPFKIADMAGLDVYESILKTLRAAYGDRFAVPEALSTRTQRGEYGTKVGKGFAEYDEAARAELLASRDQMYLRLRAAINPA